MYLYSISTSAIQNWHTQFGVGRGHIFDSVIRFSILLFFTVWGWDIGLWHGLPATPTAGQILDNLIIAAQAPRFIQNVGLENSLGGRVYPSSPWSISKHIMNSHVLELITMTYHRYIIIGGKDHFGIIHSSYM